ncbi:MAG: flagellar hook-length control protein FliK [Oscillospiraceae bacterium]|nr:flagellar hook-length control protein FliK [Oscillospiraceae bacterium]
MDLSMLNVTLGMKGISELTSGKDMFSEAVGGESFEAVFAKAVGGASDEIKVEDGDVAEADDELSFGELAQELSAKIDEAGPEVIEAAVKLVQSVGKAVENLFGGELFGSDEDDETMSITDIFGTLLNLVPEEEQESETDILSALFGSISDVIDAGFSEDMDTPDIVDQLLEALKPKDEDETSLADAVMLLLCSLSGVNYSADDFDSALITNDAVSKLGNIADILSDSTNPENTVQNLSELLKGVETEDSAIEFISYLHKQTGISFSDSIMKAANSLKVNDAAAQLTELDPDAVNAMVMPAAVTENTAETETAVFKELGEFVNVQLTEKIASEVVSKPAFDVKELTVVLRPESLGEIAVKIAADENGVLSIVMAASNAEVGKAITENAAALSESLAKQNIRVDEVNVVNPSEASSYMGLDFTNQSFNRKNDDGNSSDGSNGRGRGSVDAIGSDIDSADAARAQKLLKEAKLWATA